MHIMRSLRSSLVTAAAVGTLAFVPATFADHHGKDGAMDEQVGKLHGGFGSVVARLRIKGEGRGQLVVDHHPLAVA